MAIVLCNAYKPTLLQQQVALLNSLVLHLYQNNYTPLGTSVAGDFTEATFDGYAAQNLTTFAAAFLNGANLGETDAGLYTFTQTGVVVTNNIYGYYVTTAGGVLAFGERNAGAPVSMSTTGLSYVVNALFKLDTL